MTTTVTPRNVKPVEVVISIVFVIPYKEADPWPVHVCGVGVFDKGDAVLDGAGRRTMA